MRECTYTKFGYSTVCCLAWRCKLVIGLGKKKIKLETSVILVAYIKNMINEIVILYNYNYYIKFMSYVVGVFYLINLTFRSVHCDE